MSWSRVAFGAARCVFGVPEHEAALRRALQNGITGVFRDGNVGYVSVVQLLSEGGEALKQTTLI